MSINVETRFKDRVAEVEHYFKLLAAVEDTLVNRNATWKDGRKKLPKVLAEDLSLKMMKATSFLLLYNLVEATVRDSVQSIWQAVGSSNLKALDLLPSLRDVWVGSEFKRNDAFSASPSTYRDVATKILKSVSSGESPTIEFKRVVGGGNVNSIVIKKVCASHGISFSAPKNTRDGADLETVKNRRNTLAHGEQTFEEIGRSHAVSDLKDIKTRTVSYLRQYVRRVDRYIAQAAYRAA